MGLPIPTQKMSYIPKTLPPIPVKNSLKATLRKAEIKDFVIKYLTTNGAELPRGSPELIKFVALAIENSIHKGNKHKIDKMALAMDILAEVFPAFKEPEREVAKTLIEFLLENKSVRATPWKFFFKKVLNALGARLSL